MDSLTISRKIPLLVEETFELFVNKLTLWWPTEYTWSKDKLVELTIDPIPNGLCTEIGPNGFRCDWGTVMAIQAGHSIVLKWQITASRAPEPDPDKSSEVSVLFHETDSKETEIRLKHEKFSNHGEGHEAYRDAMASERGWPYILSAFEACTHNR